MKLFFSLSAMLLCVQLAAQLPNPSNPVVQQRAQQELAARGLTELEVRERMAAEGIDLDNLQPDQVGRVREILDQMELEKAGSGQSVPAGTPRSTPTETETRTPRRNAPLPPQFAPSTVRDIERAIDEGATVEEALSEELLDASAQQDTLTNQQVRIYGHQFFRNQNLSVFRQSDNIKVDPNYVLGSGDEITVQFFGQSVGTFTYEISSEGYIEPAQMPRMYLKGLTIAEARRLLRRQFSRFFVFTDGEFVVTLNTTRTIRVNIYGEVLRRGSYTISAINNAYNALSASGGPTDIGSVRNIQINRTAEESTTVDLYEFILEGRPIGDNLTLNNNDYIFVPVADRVVTIEGAVQRPFAYELKQGEQLQTLIRFAGGLSDNAYVDGITVRRYARDREVVLDVDAASLREGSTDFVLQPGDRVRVPRQSTRLRGSVQVVGAVVYPNRYGARENFRLSQLLDRAILADDAQRQFVFLQRLNPDSTYNFQSVDLSGALTAPGTEADVRLQEGDIVTVLSQVRPSTLGYISVEGAVENPVDSFAFDASGQLRISDAITLAGGLLPEATDFAYIFRTDPTNPKLREYISFDARDIVANPGSADNIPLQVGDRLRIFDRYSFTNELTFEVRGAVRRPDTFAFAEGASLRDAIRLAGGLVFEADPSRVEVFRTVLREGEAVQTIAATVYVDKDVESNEAADFLLDPFDKIYVRRIPQFDLEESVRVNGEVRYPGGYPLLRDNERIVDVLERAGGLTGEAFPPGATLYRAEQDVGYVVIDLKQALRNRTSIDNVILKEGDVITIPKSQDFVIIQGATDAFELYPGVVTADGRIATAFRGNKRAAYYLNEFAGGAAEAADRSRIAVLHPNGEIKRTRSFLFFRVTPKVREGSIVTVPVKPPKIQDPTDPDREKVDWGKIIADSIGQATAILSLVLLVQQVNR